MSSTPESIFTPYYGMTVEGARIGVMSCRLCGAAILITPTMGDHSAVHAAWHATLAAEIERWSK